MSGYTLPRPAHDWIPHVNGDFQCRHCYAEKQMHVDCNAFSTGCTEKPFCWFPGKNVHAAANARIVRGITWDQLDGSRVATPVYESASEASVVSLPGYIAPGGQTVYPIAVGDRVELPGFHTSGTVIYLEDKYNVHVARDDGVAGAGIEYANAWGSKRRAWLTSQVDLVLIAPSATIAADAGLSDGDGCLTPAPAPTPVREHKMGLDPETIDWSKFKKIRDML